MKDSSKEKELLIKIKHDDTKAFNEIFRLFYKKVYNFSLSILGIQPLAEDVTQEVFIAIWRNRKKIDDRGSFVSYIFSIARNQINDQVKKILHQKAFFEYLMNKEEMPKLFTESDVLLNELNSILKRLIDNLPPKRKEIFKLSRNDGLTYKQIADKLHISENTVDTQIRKALETLKEKIHQEYKSL